PERRRPGADQHCFTVAMTTNRKIIRTAVATGIVIVLGILTWLLLHAPSVREPAYHGKTLSQWLSIWDPSKSKPTMSHLVAQDSIDCENAIRAMGTNSIPFLLQWLQATDSGWKQQFLKLARKQHLIAINYVEPKDLRSRGSMGLFMLGYEARSAVPDL